MGQAKLMVFSGIEWLSREILNEVANTAVLVVAREWDEWEGDETIQVFAVHVE